MRKIKLLLIVLLLCLLSSCNIYYDKTRDNMECIDIKVYDSENNEVIGVWDNWFYIENNLEELNPIAPLNSAAPVFNYYIVNFEENKTYNVVFKFYSKKNIHLNNITFINLETDITTKIDDITKEGKNYYVTLAIENISENNRYFKLYKYNETFRFGSAGSNTYKYGIAFINDYKAENNYANTNYSNDSNNYYSF